MSRKITIGMKELEEGNLPKELKEEVSEIMEEPHYIYERNSDTGEIFRRKKGDYTNRECINPSVNSTLNLT